MLNCQYFAICQGGEVGKDTCQGEGGAPLVCLDRETDRYVAVGKYKEVYKNYINFVKLINILPPNLS